MPKISKRGELMPASPIRKLVPYSEAAKKRGVHVFHLNIGQPDIKTPEIAVDAVKKFDGKIVEYGHSAGNETYRKGLASYYKSVGVDIDYTNVLITTGASEAMYFAFWSCFSVGDEIIISEPFYSNYNGVAAATGVTVVPVTSRIEDGFILPPISEFEKKITSKTKAIIICNPNNPTGYLYSHQELEQIRQMVLKHDIYLFADEVYREFCYGNIRHKSILELEGLEQHAIVFDSVSKRYSECGLRIGALISRNMDFIDTALKFGQTRLCPPAFGQIAAEASLNVPKDYYNEVHNEYLERRNTIIEALNKLEGVYSPMPGGAFYSLVRLPIDDADRFCQWMLESFEYNRQTVMLAPAKGFYATPGLGQNEVRIAYVLKKEDLIKAVECIALALKVYPGRTL